ncbi:DUF4403 family protein [Dyadobacter fermentans]|uniref:DUF4403 family protein n=1 Tax=Dyadobacter fermentans (strain ATCC 700827 / DSM 18053 / CIP 107007 / KCTC 52180 / NS114) TaxID=471854 RepID=C6W1S1_DYAFD|nr:DUF4403 family protein [Dyadobacter fermentans]ACT93801.1 conserved hypothetical protein [Dyadobacter fermentans DSM 18053]
MEEYKYSDKEIQNEKHLSVLNVPVEVPVAEIEKQINNQIKGLIYDDNSYEDDNNDNLKAKVWKISPIKVVAIDSSFLFEVPLKIWVSAGYKVSPLGMTMSGYKDTEFSIRIRLISKIGITPSWQIKSDTYVDSYDWISEPSIRVAGINIPIKGMVSRMLSKNFDKITDAIDQQVSSNLELKKNAEVAWNLARQPVMLAQEYDTWLVIVPTGVEMTPLLAKNNILRSVIGIKGYTQTVTSAMKPAVAPAQKLPDLRIVEKVQDDFKIGLISLVSYEDAARLATRQFAGEKFSFLGGQYHVEVTSIDMYGQNDRLVIKAGLKGSISGDIYLKGIPYYDPATQQLSLKGLDYDLDTRNTIVRTAGWLLQGQFSRMMEKKMIFPVGGQIADAKSTIQKTLANYKVTEGVVVKGILSDIVPDKVYLTPKHLYSVVFATGKVNLKVDGLKGI